MSADGIYGRDKLIKRLWRRLESSSIRLTAERRVGKTEVMKKMRNDPPVGWIGVYLDVSSVRTPHRFLERLLTESHSLLTKWGKATRAIAGTAKALGGTQIGGIITIPTIESKGWESAFETAFGGICAAQPEKKIVFFLDEIPYMLQQIACSDKREDRGKRIALTMLDLLRELDGRYDNLRFMLAGSVGLHHVLRELREDKFASQPVNEMPIAEVNPLDDVDAAEFCNALIEAEELRIANESREAIVANILKQTGCVPFYIDRLIRRAAEMDRIPSAADIDELILKQLTDDKNDWEMEHFRTRLKIYYPGNIPSADGAALSADKLASTILDITATSNRPLSINEVEQQVRGQLALDDRSRVIEYLSLLAQDHYLECDTSKRYTFRYELIRRWWVISSGLSMEGQA